ncbi:MAG: hypothetical protein IPM39_06955 [Chloroflexi bacterium]|nr:hypothetical protein [Chloroflexota bacterium]
MARLNAIEFARSVQNACHESAHILSYNVQILDDTVVKIRVALSGDAFIDVFYNADTGKCSYALVQQNIRIFGADNAFIGWHKHPFKNPEQHIVCAEVSFADFLHEIEEGFYR